MTRKGSTKNINPDTISVKSDDITEMSGKKIREEFRPPPLSPLLASLRVAPFIAGFLLLGLLRSFGTLLYYSLQNNHIREGTVVGIGGNLLDFLDYIESLDDLTEDCVLSVEMRRTAILLICVSHLGG